ncbi:MAG: hypothetical protein K2X45_04270, partial [Phreatobacter sp.]|nr:hypothetical protein [Phreatobacter sp.]
MVANLADRNLSIDKSELTKLLKVAAPALGIDMKEWHLLGVLMSFLPGKTIGGAEAPIVFASNEAILERSAFNSERTLRRHVTRLCDLHLVVRRNSANGKRYACKGDDGEITSRFGIDLSPLITRLPEIRERAAAARRDRQEKLKLYRAAMEKRHSVLRLAGEAAAAGIVSEEFRDDCLNLARQTPRKSMDGERIKAIHEAVSGVYDTLHSQLEDVLLPANMAACDGHGDREYEKSNQSHDDQEEASPLRRPTNAEAGTNGAGDASSGRVASQSASRGKEALPLSEVIRLAPDIQFYATGGVRSWNDLIGVAPKLAGALGIGTHDRHRAERAFGREYAAATLALLSTRDDITNPPAYLQGLISRAERGKFAPPALLRHVQSR